MPDMMKEKNQHTCITVKEIQEVNKDKDKRLSLLKRVLAEKCSFCIRMFQNVFP
ncbi:MAG: hypothetical protein WCO84_03540 [bacterium]